MVPLTTGLALIERGDEGYERARLDSVWNGLKPDRFPAAIARVRDDADVVAAVRVARERGLRVTVRSGGHSWSANHLRDGALLIDMSDLTDVEVDAAAQTAWVTPAVKGEQLIRELRGHGLFFTTGHCNDVGLGGFTLGGGFGWMSRHHGFACTSVLALDVVTADGELVRADAGQNSDLYWAARGSGPGFFGVVTRILYQVYPDYPVTMISADVYPRAVLEDVFGWLDSQAEVSPALELRLNVGLEHPGIDGVGVRVVGSTLAQSAEEARATLALLDTCPVLDRAVSSVRNIETDVLDLVMASDDACKPGRRMVADNIWTGAPMSDLLPGICHVADTMTHESFMMWHFIGDDPKPGQDRFHSIHDRYNAAVYAVWSDPADDEAVGSWPARCLAPLEALSSGTHLNDENLARRPARVATESAMTRFEEIRAVRDPDRLFYGWPSPEPEQ
jgi:hypothetical protein